MHQRSIVFLGAPCVGKTALVCRTFGDFFPPVHVPTIKRQCYFLNLYLSAAKPHSVRLVDTSGEDYRQVCTAPEHGDAFVVVFSVTDRPSFEAARECLVGLAERGCTAILLIGNQVDEDSGLGRQVSTAEAERLAIECGAYDFMEMSALDEINTGNIRGRLSDLLSFALEQEEEMAKCHRLTCCGDFDPVRGRDTDEQGLPPRPQLLLLNRPTQSEAPATSSSGASPDHFQVCSPAASSETRLLPAETPEFPSSKSPTNTAPKQTELAERSPTNTAPTQTALAERSPELEAPASLHERHAVSPWRSFAHLVVKMGYGVSSRVSKAVHAHARTKLNRTPETSTLTKALVGHASPAHGKAKDSKLSEMARPSARVARARSFRRLREKAKNSTPSCGLIMNYQVSETDAQIII